MKRPLNPKTVLKLVRLWPHARRQGREIGQVYRVGYYCRHCGMDCVWLVDSKGRYDWTADHSWIEKHFVVIKASFERSLYGQNKPSLRHLK